MNYKIVKVTIPLLLLAVIRSTAAQTSDFYILKDPASCALFDQYEQPLSASNKKQIPLNAPFEIIDKKVFMGDQITQAMHLSYLAHTYYILLDDRGKPTGLPLGISVKHYQRCAPKYDTLIIHAPTLTLYSQYPSRGKTVRLQKGERVIRIFAYRGSTYLCHLSKSSVFGWAYIKKGMLQTPDNKKSTVVNGYDYLHTRIMHRLQNVNERYTALFTYFNGVTHQQQSIPQWTYSIKKNVYNYTLEGSPHINKQFEASTRLIVEDIERIFLGKPYIVHYNQGVITIEPR